MFGFYAVLAVPTKAPDNFTYKSETVTVDGKDYRLQYVVVDGVKSKVDIGYALAKQRMGFRDDPDKISRYVGAAVAINGPYHKESNGWSKYLIDSTHAVGGKAIRIFNAGSQFCVANNGSWYFGKLRFKMMGAVKESLLPATLRTIQISGLNEPAEGNSTTLYTDEWKRYTPSNSTNAIIQGGIVTDVVNGEITVPSGAYVICYTGTNRERTSKTRWPKGYIRKGLHISIYWAPAEGNEVNLNAWRNSKLIFGGSPTLVKNGKPYWNPYGEGHVNQSALSYTSKRTAFGIDGKGKAYFVTFLDSIHIKEMGPVLVKIGVNYAFNLDGGCSTYLWYDDKEYVQNCRDLPCVIYAKPAE